MSLFDSLKDEAGQLVHGEAHGEAHDALRDALDDSPLGGMSGLLDKLHEGGLEGAVEAWTQGDEHPPVSAEQLHEALGDEHVQHLASSLGVSTDQLLSGLSEHLPALAAAHEASEAADDAGADDHPESDAEPAEAAHDDADHDEAHAEEAADA